MSFRSVVGLFAASILLGQGLPSVALIGLGLIILGITVTSIRERTLHFHKADLLAFVCAFAYGTVNVIDKINLQSSDLLLYTSLSYIVPALLGGIVFMKQMHDVRLFFASPFRLLKVALVSAVTATGATAYFIAISIAPNINQVVALSLLSIIITVVASIIVFKDRSHLPQKVTGALLSILGAYIVMQK